MHKKYKTEYKTRYKKTTYRKFRFVIICTIKRLSQKSLSFATASALTHFFSNIPHPINSSGLLIISILSSIFTSISLCE